MTLEEETKLFIEQATAIIEQDLEKLFESGFLDIDDYKDSEGNMDDNAEEHAMEDYSEDLLYKSRQIMTAFEIDNENQYLDKINSIADLDNIDKAYSLVTLKGEHMYLDIVLSNSGEVYIQAFDKEGNHLYYEEFDNISSDHELFLLANHIAGGEEEFRYFTPERNIDELAYYFRASESHFGTDEDLKDFQLNILRDMNGKDIFYPIRGKNVIADLESQLEYYNSILIEKSGREELNQLIFEIDGNVFFHELVENGNFYDSKFEFVEEGEAFIFRGAVGIARQGELKLIEMQLYGNYEIHANELEDNAEPAPVKKKQSKFKP